jgi:hypothetical protein
MQSILTVKVKIADEWGNSNSTLADMSRMYIA